MMRGFLFFNISHNYYNSRKLKYRTIFQLSATWWVFYDVDVL